ncbi:MAG: bifunctional 4-hydroxy-2-oxoglutarate aldolase/2-dehydro-3-deoxy-phosphogluconate aldolase [Thermoguttaceae bacterium]|jgi:2-dehydro-3-deoxyphosphogluconate aldolase/(4S)-4-hydroxy-2-oxoglutarate aldolase
MATKQEVLASLRQSGVVAVIRTETPEDLVAVSRALRGGGVKFIEITMTVPGALEIIRDAAAQLRGADVFIGAGTVLDAPTARAAIIAGAQFIVGPAFDVEMVKLCNSYGVVVMPGAFTPHEVFQAWKGGADVVKVFPADIGGPDYLKTIKEPLPQVELLPTKGIDFDTAALYIKAGAIAVGTGSCLVNKALIAAKDHARIMQNADRFTRIVREAKGEAR